MFKELTLILSKPRKQGVTDTVQRSGWWQRQGTGEFFWKEEFKTCFLPPHPLQQKNNQRGGLSYFSPRSILYCYFFFSGGIFFSILRDLVFPFVWNFVLSMRELLSFSLQESFIFISSKILFLSFGDYFFMFMKTIFHSDDRRQ